MERIVCSRFQVAYPIRLASDISKGDTSRLDNNS